VPCRDSSRHVLYSLTRCASHPRGPGVEKSLDAARRSACATKCGLLGRRGVHNCFREFVQLRCRPLIVAMGTAGETACPTLLDQWFGEVGGAGGSPAGGS